MVGNGAPKIQTNSNYSDKKLAIVVASWNEEICNSLLENALNTASQHSLASEVFRVAGSFELIAAADRAIAAGFDAVALFGVIIRGETPHFDYVSQAVTQGAVELSFRGVPIGFGVLTCDDYQQALDRSGIATAKENKGKDTIEAIMMSLDTFALMQKNS